MMDFQQRIKEIEQKLKTTDFIASEQRTDEWFKQRLGKFTGSRISELMAVGRSGGKLVWGTREKLYDFSETALRYIYEKAMERKYEYVIKVQSSLAMKYGTENEDVIINLFLEKNPFYNFKKLGFQEITKYLGASPDGELIDEFNKSAVEVKASTNWSTFYSRIEIDFDEKHQDFWQVQTEMMSLKAQKCMYIVGLPPENILETQILDVEWKYIEASPIHQQCILERAKIGNAIIEMYLNGHTFRKSVEEIINNYKSIK